LESRRVAKGGEGSPSKSLLKGDHGMEKKGHGSMKKIYDKGRTSKTDNCEPRESLKGPGVQKVPMHTGENCRRGKRAQRGGGTLGKSKGAPPENLESPRSRKSQLANSIKRERKDMGETQRKSTVGYSGIALRQKNSCPTPRGRDSKRGRL